MTTEDILFYNEFASNINHEIKKIRVNALNELEKHVNSDISQLYSTGSEDNYLTSLLKLFKDDAEVCREKSIKLVTRYIDEQTTVNEELCITALLLIHDRLGKETTQETSEEIRNLLLKLLILLIFKNDNISSTYVKNIIEILINCLNDSYSEVKKTAFELTENVAKKFPNWFPEYSENISKSLLMCTKHKHFRVRAAAINCLKVVLEYCDKETICIICGSLGECLLDVNVHVRVAVLRAASYWLQELPNKYSYACYILPLILSCLSDESDECQKEVFDSWSKIGLMYIKDNKDKLKEKIQYLPEEVFKSDYDVTVQNYGCSLLVSDHVARFLPTIITELDDWRTEVKIKSAALLKVTIAHVRCSIIPFLDLLLPALLKKCCDEEITVSKNIIETAEYIGKVVSAKIYWKLFDVHLKNGCSLNHLIILSSLLKFSNDEEIGAIIKDIALILLQQQILEIHENSVQQRVLEIFTKLLNCCDDTKLDAEITDSIYLILLTTMAEADEQTQSKTLELIDVLCKVSEFKCTLQLNRFSFKKLYDQFLETCPLWQSHSTNFKLFIVTLSRFSDDVFEIAAEKFIKICEIILQPSFDKEVSFKILLNIGRLIENERINLNKNINLIEKFLLDSLKPQLIWRSGRIVEVIRNSALIIFNLYSERVAVANFSLIYEFIPLLISLSEDNYEDTRIAALCALASTGRLLQRESSSSDFFIKMLTAAIQRLEDTSHRVRLMACTKIVELLTFAPSIDKNIIKADILTNFKTIELLFIMSCDKNAEIRNAVRETLKHPSMSNFLKQLFPQESLNILIGICRDEELSTALKKSLVV